MPVLILALCLRLGLFLVAAAHPDRFFTPDSYGYVRLGVNFREAYAAGSGAAFDPTSPGTLGYPLLVDVGPSGALADLALWRTPGYPLLINTIYAIVGERPWSVILVQLALSVLTVWLAYVLGLKLFGPQAAFWAGLALAIDPISIIMPNYLQPEALFTATLMFGFLCLLQGRGQRPYMWMAVAGGLLGASALIRPVTLYLPAVLLPISWALNRGRWSMRVMPSAVFLLAFALPTGGWVARNYLVTDVPVLSTIQGANLLNYRAAGALSQDEGVSVNETQRRLRMALRRRARAGMNQAEISQVATHLGLETLSSHPVGASKTVIRGIAFLLGGPGRAELLQLVGVADQQGMRALLPSLLVAMEFVVLALALIGAGCGCYGLLRTRRFPQLSILAGVVIYLIVISAGAESYSRYRAPIMPFFAILAGYAIAYQVPGWLRHRRQYHPGTMSDPLVFSEVNRKST